MKGISGRSRKGRLVQPASVQDDEARQPCIADLAIADTLSSHGLVVLPGHCTDHSGCKTPMAERFLNSISTDQTG